jgi:hypothetical protein
MANKFLIVLYVILIFSLGFFASQLLNKGMISGQVVSETPKDYISEREILVYSDRIVIKVENASISNYDNTGSMAPVLGEGVNGIKVRPRGEDDVNVGDIVSFDKGGGVIVHRVIEKGIDGDGVYFVTKGDNALIDDGKIRFVDIEWKTIGLIY